MSATLKPGWLADDVRRAAARVDEWNSQGERNTMTFVQLKDLERRLAEAKGPDRELDGRLAVLGGEVVMRGDEVDGFAFFRAPVKPGDWAFLSGCKKGEAAAFASLGECLSTKSYTASLDAAVSLTGRVLPGWFWRVGHSTLYAGWAHLNRTHLDNCDRKDEASAEAATPTLALCLACVRALIAQGEK